MTDKVQKIREEVVRLKKWNNNVRNSTRHMTLQEEDFNRGKHSSYLEILNFIDSLQEEHEFQKDGGDGMRKVINAINTNFSKDPVSEDLKEEIERIKKEYYADDPHAIVSMMGVQIEEIARHFANWQKQQMMKKTYLKL